MLKAYDVHDKAGGIHVIAFAGNERKARKLALETLWLECSDYVSLRAKRIRRADKFGASAVDPFVMDGSKINEQVIMRDLGWHEYEGSHESCVGCSKYVWNQIQESHLNEHYLCWGCRKESNHER